MEPCVAVLMLGYNDKNNLKEALDSVLFQTYKNFRVIYIDNASNDGSLKFVKQNYPNIRIITNTENLGYAGAYKQVLEKTFSENFEAVVLLNSDVIVDKDWLRELVNSAYSDPKTALAQPKIFLWDEKNNTLANSFGNKINYLGFGFCGHYKKPDSLEFKEDREITYASGASLIIKKEAYLNIGEIDGDFFAYLEDQDLGWRARMKGYKIVLSSKSKMWHKYKFQKNSRNHRKFFMLERNRLYFIFKNYSCKTIFFILPVFIAMEIGMIFDSIFSGYFTDKIKSYFSFLRNLKNIKRKRNIIQESRKVSDAELFRFLSPVINFEEINSPLLALANFFLKMYYNLIKNLI